jgi:hypothetical protein
LLKEREVLKKSKRKALAISTVQSPEEPFALHTYYISRFQVWVSTPNGHCSGKITLYL